MLNLYLQAPPTITERLAFGWVLEDAHRKKEEELQVVLDLGNSAWGGR